MARPAPPNFATCSTYRRRPMLQGANSMKSFNYPDVSKGAIPKNTKMPQSPAARPEDLRVTPWYMDDAMPATPPGPGHDHSSNPRQYSFADRYFTRPDLPSTQNSSMESDLPRPPGAQRKAYMDLRDAIALLDETCPNPDISEPSPRTPRTPLTPHAKSKRARSKSSDNSSNYSNERLSEKSMEPSKTQEREKKRPFLRKIGISKTEDRPFLSKFTPRIIGKPYLEKIGPSKAIEKPFLEKIGSSKTIDKFTFNIMNSSKNLQEPEVFESSSRLDEPQRSPAPRLVPRDARSSFRRRSGKGQLQKMYSFETEDLNSFKGSMSPVKSPRDPLRGASLDDVLESGPSSLPPLDVIDQVEEYVEPEPKSQSVAELVKCRIMSSEDIISSNSCLSSPQEAVSWGNSPKRKNEQSLKTPDRRGLRPQNSPVKRQISNDSPEPKPKELAVLRPGEKSPTKSRHSVLLSGSSTLPKQREVLVHKTSEDRNVLDSPNQTRRQTSEDILDKMDKRTPDRKNHSSFERRGISSDNLKLSREMFITASFDPASMYQSQDICVNKDRATVPKSQESIIRRLQEVPSASQEFSREAFKQLHSKFELRSMASDVALARRDPEKTNDRPKAPSDTSSTRSRLQLYQADDKEHSTSLPSSSIEKSIDDEEEFGETVSADELESGSLPSRTSHSGVTVRSVLRKQKSIDHQSDQELDTKSVRKPKRRIFHEPSQETMDLLTELRKVKSQLKSPSVERLDKAEDMPPSRFPKKILLTDKEFCLSIERENSIRRPGNRTVANLQTTEPDQETSPLPGPALFEKRCMSLDYADDEKPPKPETRAISLASARSPPSETEETNSLEFGMVCDSKSYCSDVFNTPSEEIEDGKERTMDSLKDPEEFDKVERNHCAEVDIAIPIDQKTSPRRRVQIQARTSDLYEIISPRSTPFRVKKRLSKISVEETLKQESFSLGKVDCRSVAVQKRNRCIPL